MRNARPALALVLALAAGGCRQQEKNGEAQPAAEQAPTLASFVQMNDPKAAAQLVSGFHGIESNAWRWTAKNFVVALRPPAGGAQKGAVLQLHLTVPQPTIQALGSVTLSASAGGAGLAPETYSQTGRYTYQRDVPAGALGGNPVRVEFHLDKAMPPGSPDIRELGIIVSGVGLAAR
jgi:hypothetical protein